MTEHVSDVVAMMLADGEEIPPAAAHVAACDQCTARVAAFRAEAALLASAFALDDDELASLISARLPAAVAGRAAQPLALPAARLHHWESPALLALGTLVAVTVAAGVGWQAAAGTVMTLAAAAQGAGATEVLANVLVGWMLGLAQLLWQATMAVAALPAIDAPALPLVAMAALLWVALAITPRAAALRRVAA